MPIPIDNFSAEQPVEVSTPQTVPAENATTIEPIPSEPAPASLDAPMESISTQATPIDFALTEPTPAEIASNEPASIEPAFTEPASINATPIEAAAPAPAEPQPVKPVQPVTASEHTEGNGIDALASTTTNAAPAISPSSLAGKVALVTGSSRGIGRGIILELAGRGADCVVNYCGNVTAAQSVVKECQALGVKATAIQADVSDVESIKKMYAQAMSYFGHLDIIVSNSGVEHFSTIEETTPEMYDYVMNINTRGQFFVAQQGYLNISHGGRIIMMSSVAANIRGLAHHSIYSASKAAIEAMVRSFPSDFSPKRVTVNAIAPAGIESDMASVNGWRYFPGGTPDMPLDLIAKNLSEACPLKRFGQPKDVARVVAFLSSEEGGWINGESR